MMKLYARYRTFDLCAAAVGCNRKTWSKYWNEVGLPNPRSIPKIDDASELETYRIAIASDMHLGSREQQLTSLYNFMDSAVAEQIDTLLICGDMVEGIMPRMGASQSRFLHGIDEIFEYTCSVFDYFADRFEVIHLINGNHDNSLNGRSYGFDVAYNLSTTFSTVSYNRNPEDGMAPIVIDGGIKAVLHHGIGGCAQNLTTRTRNLSAKFLNYDSDWDFLFAGHCHNTSEDYWLGKYSYSCGCFQAITPYLATKLLTPRIEAMILSYQVDDSGKVCNVRRNAYNYDKEIRRQDW